GEQRQGIAERGAEQEHGGKDAKVRAPDSRNQGNQDARYARGDGERADQSRIEPRLQLRLRSSFHSHVTREGGTSRHADSGELANVGVPASAGLGKQDSMKQSRLYQA